MHLCVRLSRRADDVEDSKQAVRCADVCDDKEGGPTYRIEMRVVKLVCAIINLYFLAQGSLSRWYYCREATSRTACWSLPPFLRLLCLSQAFDDDDDVFETSWPSPEPHAEVRDSLGIRQSYDDNFLAFCASFALCTLVPCWLRFSHVRSFGSLLVVELGSTRQVNSLRCRREPAFLADLRLPCLLLLVVCHAPRLAAGRSRLESWTVYLVNVEEGLILFSATDGIE